MQKTPLDFIKALKPMFLKIKTYAPPDRSVLLCSCQIFTNLNFSQKTVKEFIFSTADLQLSTLLRNKFFFRYFKVS